MAAVDDGYVGVAEAAELLKVSRSTLWRWIDQGRLPAFRLGQRRVLIRQADLAKLITPARKTEPPAGAVTGGTGSSGAESNGVERSGMTSGGMGSGREMTLEEARAWFSRPLTEEEKERGRAAFETARRFAEEMRRRNGGRLFSDSTEIIREMRDERSRERW